MMTTWQKMIAIFIGIVFGIIVGYICIKPHLKDDSVPATQNITTNDMFDQYLKNDSNTNVTDNQNNIIDD